ncbi:MAG: phosphatidate cytidylyltransferase [bacterium]
MSRNLITRILVAAVAIPIILWISYEGGWWLLGLLGLLALAAISEYLVNEGISPRQVFFWVALVCTLLLLAVIADTSGSLLPTFLTTMNGSTLAIGIIILFFTLTAMLSAIGRQSPAQLFERHSRLVWGVLYVGLLYPIVYLIGNGIGEASGGDCLLFLFGLLWVGDTTAMAVGSWLGRRRLAPTVSPNKTVEGFVGGVAGAVAVGVLIYFWKLENLGLLNVMILAVGCSVLGQLGDLVESMWKRSLGIKDSSPLVPGHGGVLDRFDSLLFAAPFMYVFLYFTQR